MKSGGHIDQDWVSKLITRNRALKSSLTAIIQREAPDRSIDLETLIAAFYGATNTPGAAAVSLNVASMASTPTDRHEHAIAASARRHHNTTQATSARTSAPRMMIETAPTAARRSSRRRTIWKYLEYC